MLVAVNRTHKNKPQSEDKAKLKGEYRRINKSFENLDITLSQLADEVRNGYAFCAQHTKRWRSSANFLQSGFLAVDVDHGLRVEDALARNRADTDRAAVMSFRALGGGWSM
jgi:hypothetical protein